LSGLSFIKLLHHLGIRVKCWARPVALQPAAALTQYRAGRSNGHSRRCKHMSNMIAILGERNRVRAA
jgi:hypothetical protein